MKFPQVFARAKLFGYTIIIAAEIADRGPRLSGEFGDERIEVGVGVREGGRGSDAIKAIADYQEYGIGSLGGGRW